MSAVPLKVPGPALAMLELDDMPAGLLALDALVKEASVQVLAQGTVQPGHYLLLFAGEVEPVQRSFARACKLCRDSLLDRVLLAHAEERIVPALLRSRRGWPAPGDTLGVLQTSTAPVMLAAVDRALKGAQVELIELRCSEGLGGKALASVWGKIYDVQAALDLAQQALDKGPSLPSSRTMIPNADPAVIEAVRDGTRFFREWRG